MRRTGTKPLKESQSRRLPSGGTFSDSFFLRPESSVPTGRKTKAAWKKAFRLVRGSGADDDADGSQLLQALTLAADEGGSGGALAEAASPPARTSVATWTPSGGDTGQAQAVEGAASASKLRWKKAVAKTIVVARFSTGGARRAKARAATRGGCIITDQDDPDFNEDVAALVHHVTKQQRPRSSAKKSFKSAVGIYGTPQRRAWEQTPRPRPGAKPKSGAGAASPPPQAAAAGATSTPNRTPHAVDHRRPRHRVASEASCSAEEAPRATKTARAAARKQKAGTTRAPARPSTARQQSPRAAPSASGRQGGAGHKGTQRPRTAPLRPSARSLASNTRPGAAARVHGWTLGDAEPDVYSSNGMLFRSSTDGTGHDRHMTIWPDNLPPAMRRQWQAFQDFQTAYATTEKPKWDRVSQIRNTNLCRAVSTRNESEERDMVVPYADIVQKGCPLAGTGQGEWTTRGSS